MSQVQKFNRHEVFNDEDRSLVLDMITRLSKIEFPNQVNMLYGLFDGYWYGELEDSLLETKLPNEMLTNLTSLLDRVGWSE